MKVDWKVLQRGSSCHWHVQVKWALLGALKEGRWIPGTGRTDRRTMEGTAVSASCLQRISYRFSWVGLKRKGLLNEKLVTVIEIFMHACSLFTSV
jgi:hypothetical protein